MQLDHILPHKIAGDPLDGSNWQLLCKPCNGGKRDLLSALQHRVSHGWIYHLDKWVPEQERRADKKTIRFATLVREEKCHSCGSGPKDRALEAFNSTKGLSIPENMSLICEICATD